MKTSFKLIAVVVGILASNLSFAGDQVSLFNETSDAFDGTLKVSLAVDANSNATGFVYNITSDTDFPLANLTSGIVLYESSNRNVITLTGKNFSPTTGGELTLTYLQSGISNTYETFDFGIARTGQSWDAYIINSRNVQTAFISMYLAANTFLGEVIGIESITVK